MRITGKNKVSVFTHPLLWWLWAILRITPQSWCPAPTQLALSRALLRHVDLFMWIGLVSGSVLVFVSNDFL